MVENRRDTDELAAKLEAAAEELAQMQTAQEIKNWWRRHYSVLGHKRLGRLILGQPVDRLIESL